MRATLLGGAVCVSERDQNRFPSVLLQPGLARRTAAFGAKKEDVGKKALVPYTTDDMTPPQVGASAHIM